MLGTRARSWIAAVALSTALIAPAVADDDSDARDVAGLAVLAMAQDEPDVVVVLMDRSVAFDLDAPACGKPYTRPGRATGAARRALARCLEQFADRVRLGRRDVLVGPVVQVEFVLGPDSMTLDLRRVKGRLRIVAVRARSTEYDAPDPEDGVEGGIEGGVVGGVVGGVIGGVDPGPPPPPPPPPPPRPRQNVPPTALESLRLAGDKDVVPDDATKDELARSGKTRLVVPVKLCIDPRGKVSSAKVLKSSGFVAYDARLSDTITRTWRYRPFMVNGQATAVCSIVTFVYQQQP